MGDEVPSKFLLPEALLNIEKTLINLRQKRYVERKKDFVTVIETEDGECFQLYQQFLDQKKSLENEIKQLRAETEHVKREVYEMEVEKELIKNNITTLKQDLSSVKKQFPDEEELSKLMEKVCSIKDDIGRKKSHLKKEMEKFKKGILFYQKYLHCKVMLVSKDTLVITLDVSSKPATELREYLKFSIHDNGTRFQFIEMRPKLKSEQELVKTFSETGDIQGFIASFWYQIKRMSVKNVLSEKNN